MGRLAKHPEHTANARERIMMAREEWQARKEGRPIQKWIESDKGVWIPIRVGQGQRGTNPNQEKL